MSNEHDWTLSSVMSKGLRPMFHPLVDLGMQPSTMLLGIHLEGRLVFANIEGRAEPIQLLPYMGGCDEDTILYDADHENYIEMRNHALKRLGLR